MRVLTVEDKAEKKKAKKERQRNARAQAAAREAPKLAAGSGAAQQLPSSAQRSSPASPALLAGEQKPSSTAQAGAPAVEAVLQAARRLPPEPAEALPLPPSDAGRKGRKGKGKLNRSGALPSGVVYSASAVQATPPGVPGSTSTAALPVPHTSTAQAKDEHASAPSSPAEHPESSPSTLRGSSSAQRLHFPIYEAVLAAHQPQNGGSSMLSFENPTAQDSQASSPAPAAPEEESWQEVRSGRRTLAAKPTAAKAGKGRRGGQTLPETLPKPTAAAPMTPHRAQHLQAPPGFAARPELPKSWPTQADIGEAPRLPALHASLQRQPAQAPVNASPAAMHHWPTLQASARPEPERISEPLDLAAVRAPQQNMDHVALLKDLLLQPKASSTTTKQHTVQPLQRNSPIVC